MDSRIQPETNLMGDDWNSIHANQKRALEWLEKCRALMNEYGDEVWVLPDYHSEILRDALAHRYCVAIDNLSDSVGASRDGNDKEKTPKDKGMLYDSLGEETWSKIHKLRVRLTHYYHDTNIAMFKNALTNPIYFDALYKAIVEIEALSKQKVIDEEGL